MAQNFVETSLEALRSNQDHAVRLVSANLALARAFLGWQCRIRQIAFRQDHGRPSDGMSPMIYAAGDARLIGRIIAVLNKVGAGSTMMEFRHMYRRTHDPNQRRSDATKFLSESYFQNPVSFSDRLTSVFPPRSRLAAEIVTAGRCRLVCRQFNQGYELNCEAVRLPEAEPLFQASFWHNALFNPNLPKTSEILAFIPDWSRCSADPDVV